MATVDTNTMDNEVRTQFFVKTPEGGLELLPFELVTIDYDIQFYEPVSNAWRDENGLKRRGKLGPPVILSGHTALPYPAENTPARGENAVWEYYG